MSIDMCHIDQLPNESTEPAGLALDGLQRRRQPIWIDLVLACNVALEKLGINAQAGDRGFQLMRRRQQELIASCQGGRKLGLPFIQRTLSLGHFLFEALGTLLKYDNCRLLLGSIAVEWEVFGRNHGRMCSTNRAHDFRVFGLLECAHRITTMQRNRASLDEFVPHLLQCQRTGVISRFAEQSDYLAVDGDVWTPPFQRFKHLIDQIAEGRLEQIGARLAVLLNL